MTTFYRMEREIWPVLQRHLPFIHSRLNSHFRHTRSELYSPSVQTRSYSLWAHLLSHKKPTILVRLTWLTFNKLEVENVNVSSEGRSTENNPLSIYLSLAKSTLRQIYLATLHFQARSTWVWGDLLLITALFFYFQNPHSFQNYARSYPVQSTPNLTDLSLKRKNEFKPWMCSEAFMKLYDSLSLLPIWMVFNRLSFEMSITPPQFWKLHSWTTNDFRWEQFAIRKHFESAFCTFKKQFFPIDTVFKNGRFSKTKTLTLLNEISPMVSDFRFVNWVTSKVS